jgi:hypothetical protein
MKIPNLNELLISNADGPDKALQDFRSESVDGLTKVYFKNLELELVNRIREADIVVGCVAWLTSKPILLELQKKKGVSIIVQKEDFLRPDLAAPRNWKRELQKLYSEIPRALTRYDHGFTGTEIHMMSFASDPSLDPIRCVGNYNVSKAPAFPRAHHKFVLFCRSKTLPIEHRRYHEALTFEPYEVWTGSFNFTKNAGNSFENAIISRDKNLVSAFFKEYGQIAALSERLDWETEWTVPEWRIGT